MSGYHATPSGRRNPRHDEEQGKQRPDQDPNLQCGRSFRVDHMRVRRIVMVRIRDRVVHKVRVVVVACDMTDSVVIRVDAPNIDLDMAVQRQHRGRNEREHKQARGQIPEGRMFFMNEEHSDIDDAVSLERRCRLQPLPARGKRVEQRQRSISFVKSEASFAHPSHGTTALHSTRKRDSGPQRCRRCSG